MTGLPLLPATAVGAAPPEDQRGPHADWVRNVRAAGTATIEHEGRRVRVAGPERRPAAEANQIFPPRQQRTHRLYGVHDVLFLRRADAS